MTSWGVVILLAAVYFGLKRGLSDRHRYAAALAVVVFAVMYGAYRQHTF